MALPLLPSPADGWWEARTKTAMCGSGDAAGAKLGTDPVRTGLQRTWEATRRRPPRPAASRSAGRCDARCWRRVVAEPPQYSEAGKAGHMGKGGCVTRSAMMTGRTLPNGDAPWPDLDEARAGYSSINGSCTVGR